MLGLDLDSSALCDHAHAAVLEVPEAVGAALDELIPLRRTFDSSEFDGGARVLLDASINGVNSGEPEPGVWEMRALAWLRVGAIQTGLDGAKLSTA